MSKIKGELKPNPDPQWVKETVGLYLEQALVEANDGEIRGSEIDAEAARMCEADDARLREQTYKYTPAKPPERAEKAAQRLGWRFMRGQERLRQRRVEEGRMSPWVKALRARIHTLIAPMPGTRWRDQDFIYPEYANAFAMELVAMQQRTGKYKGMPDRVAQRAFSRFCENLADKSAAIVGLPDWRRGTG